MKTILHKPSAGEEKSAVEYVFPLVPERAGMDCRLLADVARVLGNDAKLAESVIAERFASIEALETRSFLRLFEGRTPSSVMICEARAWIVMKRDSAVSQRTAFDNAIMLPYKVAKLGPREIARFDFSSAPFALEFVNHFGGLAWRVPPASSECLWTDELFVADQSRLDGLGEWSGSLGVYIPGNGDVILMKEDGRAGYWSHEWSPPIEDCPPPENWIDKIWWEIRKKSNIEMSSFLAQAPTAVENMNCNIVDAAMNDILEAFRCASTA